jgi:F-type H+-transporting ATPase subunit b
VAGLVIASALEPAQNSLLASLPDPMRPDLPALAFVIVLVIVLFFYLRSVFFNPITALMNQREKDMNAGNDAKAAATAAIEARQADYNARLKELRAQAFSHKKALSEAAAKEKQALIEEARTKAAGHRELALDSLRTQQSKAKAELTAQVGALSESMVQHLLKQA